MEKPVCVVALHDNSLTSDPLAHVSIRIGVFSVVHLGYGYDTYYYCRVCVSVSSNTDCILALLSVITEED